MLPPPPLSPQLTNNALYNFFWLQILLLIQIKQVSQLWPPAAIHVFGQFSRDVCVGYAQPA